MKTSTTVLCRQIQSCCSFLCFYVCHPSRSPVKTNSPCALAQRGLSEGFKSKARQATRKRGAVLHAGYITGYHPSFFRSRPGFFRRVVADSMAYSINSAHTTVASKTMQTHPICANIGSYTAVKCLKMFNESESVQRLTRNKLPYHVHVHANELVLVCTYFVYFVR